MADSRRETCYHGASSACVQFAQNKPKIQPRLRSKSQFAHQQRQLGTESDNERCVHMHGASRTFA